MHERKRKNELNLCFDNPLDHNRFFLTRMCRLLSNVCATKQEENEKQNRVPRTHLLTEHNDYYFRRNLF